MRVLITGISGYLGYEMAHYFQERGHKVFGIDHNECDEFDSVVTGNILDLSAQPFVVDAIAHLAGASKLDSSYSELYYYKNNVEVSRKLKGLYPSTPILMASTTGMYNEQGVVEHKFHYSRTKEMAEEYADGVFRMGTICGINRRGVSKNIGGIIPRDAMEKGRILVAQGEKYRPLLKLDSAVSSWYNAVLCAVQTGTVDQRIDLYESCVTITEFCSAIKTCVTWYTGRDIEIVHQSGLDGIDKQAPWISPIPPGGIPPHNEFQLMKLAMYCVDCYTHHDIS